MSRLKPCPFCGCTIIRDFQPFERKVHVIDCNRCNGGFHEINRDHAVKMWNRRAASVDTRPQGGDVKQAPFTGGAVGSEADETPKEPRP